MERTLTKVVYYSDWNDMVTRTKLDIEFLDAFQIKYEYSILLDNNYVIVEFKCING